MSVCGPLGAGPSPPATYLQAGTGPFHVPHTIEIWMLAVQGSSEVQLRYSLRVCLFLCGIWPSSLLPATQSWDYYYKHMVGLVVLAGWNPGCSIVCRMTRLGLLGEASVNGPVLKGRLLGEDNSLF